MKVRTRIGLVVAAVLALVALAGVALPHLVDVEAYRPALVRAVKDATGRELVIEGPLQLSMFPQPRISARKVRFANAVGTKGAQMAAVEWIGVSPAWAPLLLGRLEVGRLTLYKPVIVLEADAQGRPNWQFAPGAGAAQQAGEASAGFHLAIGRLRIVQGTLTYTAPTTGKVLTAANVDLTASVGSLDGPFTLEGTARVNGVPLDLALDVGAPTDKGHRAAVRLRIDDSPLDFTGQLSRFAVDAEVNGRLTVATGGLANGLAGFVAALLRVAGETPPALVAKLTDRFAFEGNVDLSAARLALTDFKLSIGDDAAAGSLAVTRGGKPALDGRLSLIWLDVDRWIDRLSGSDDAAASPLASPFAVSLAVEAKEVTYRKDRVRDIELVVAIDRGLVEIPRLRAVLPGEAVLQAKAVAPAVGSVGAATGTKPAPDAVRTVGEFSLASPRPRDTLAWLGMDMSGVPADRLQTLGFGGTITSTAKAVKIDQLVLELDGVKATGGGSVTFGLPLNVASAVTLDRFDLDAYVPKTAAAVAPPPAAPSAAAPVAPSKPDEKAPILGLKAKVAKLVYRGETLNGVEADLAIQGNLLRLNSLKVADLLGAKLDLKGQVADFGTDPRFDLTFTTGMPDTDKLLGYVGLPKFINGKIGASTANGAVVGTMDAVTVRNVTVTMAGATARATGSVALGEKFAFDFSSFGLQAQDASQLVSVASGQRQSGLGSLEAAGAFKGNEKSMTFDGNLTALGTPMIGRISASVSGRPSVDANLRIPGTLDIDNWLGVGGASGAASGAPANAAPGPARAATGKAIDLSALRAFDATLNLETSVIEVSSLKVLYGDMTASLRNGVLKVSKLTGQFYGGAVDFTGTVDASKAALSLDFAGSLQGIYLGELLRGAASTSTFGNDHLMVAVDGKINVMEIGVRGQGNSPGQIRDSLTGRGKVSGYVYPSVAAGSLGLASFATNVGSIFSTEMGFGATMLSGFINVQSTVAGDLDLSNGILALRNQKVQGRNAVASIDSRTSLTAATTDTTITLDAGGRGAVDYVVKVTGPVASPTMNIGR